MNTKVWKLQNSTVWTASFLISQKTSFLRMDFGWEADAINGLVITSRTRPNSFKLAANVTWGRLEFRSYGSTGAYNLRA